MMEFPTLVYRCPGEHHAHDGMTYSYAAAANKEVFDLKLSEGWSASLVEAVDAINAPILMIDNQDSMVDNQVTDENDPPIRAEIELKAKELGIKFDGRTSDAKLLKLIGERL